MADALQVATSAFALAELARETAVLVWNLCKARKDARGLHKKTRNLSKLVKTIGDYLERRHEQGGSPAITSENGQTEESITDSLNLCKACLEGIREKLTPLLDTSERGLQLVARVKFVFSRDYIKAQEQDITMHLSTLSIWLQLLWHDEHISERQKDAAYGQRIEQAIRYQQQVHENSVRQLLALLAYIIHRAEAASVHPSSATAAAAQRTQVEPQDILGISSEDGQTLEDLFGRPTNPQSTFEAFSFPGPRVEEVIDDEVAVTAADEDDHEEQALALDEHLEEGESELSRPRSIDMVQFASETTLLLAIKSNSIELVRTLIKEGADTTWKDSHDWTLLHHAIFRSHREIVSMLLNDPECRKSQTINTQTRTGGETALILAAQRVNRSEGYYIAMELLELENCDVNISDGKGSALYYTVAEGKPTNGPRRKLVETLMKKGADVRPVYNKIPENVNSYPELSEAVAAIKAEANNNTANPDLRRDSNAGAETRRESTSTKAKRFSISRVISWPGRRNSSSPGGNDTTGTTPPI